MGKMGLVKVVGVWLEETRQEDLQKVKVKNVEVTSNLQRDVP